MFFGRVSAVGDAPNTSQDYNTKQHLIVNGTVGVLLIRPLDSKHNITDTRFYTVWSFIKLQATQVLAENLFFDYNKNMNIGALC